MTNDESTPKLEELPYHALKKACKKEGIYAKNTDKKADLIKMLRSGKTSHKPKEIKRAPQHADSKTTKSLPIVPHEIREELKELSKRGLTWDIDEDSNCINFNWNMPTCANLDQTASNILRTAHAARGGNRPIEISNRPSGAPVEWR